MPKNKHTNWQQIGDVEKIFVYSLLLRSSFLIVAENDQEPVAVIVLNGDDPQLVRQKRQFGGFGGFNGFP